MPQLGLLLGPLGLLYLCSTTPPQERTRWAWLQETWPALLYLLSCSLGPASLASCLNCQLRTTEREWPASRSSLGGLNQLRTEQESRGLEAAETRRHNACYVSIHTLASNDYTALLI